PLNFILKFLALRETTDQLHWRWSFAAVFKRGKKPPIAWKLNQNHAREVFERSRRNGSEVKIIQLLWSAEHTNSASVVRRCGPIGKLSTVLANISAIGNAPRVHRPSRYAPERCGGTG